jgi:hypothetical protein
MIRPAAESTRVGTRIAYILDQKELSSAADIITAGEWQVFGTAPLAALFSKAIAGGQSLIVDPCRSLAQRWGNRPAFLWIAEDLGCCASG